MNEIEIVVRGVNRSKPAFKEPGEDADKLKAKLSGTDEVLLKLMADFNRTGAGASKFGRSLMDDGNFAKFLDEQIAKTSGETRKLGEEFTRTGNIDVFKKIKSNQDAEDAMKKINADLARAFEDGAGEGGKQGGQSFVKNFAESFAGVGDVMIPALIATVAISSPLIGGAINAALVTGVGLGGVATGIVGQLHDPQVHNAITDLGNDLLAKLHVDTEPFKKPLITAIHDIEDQAGHMLDRIDFSKLATTIGPLEHGIMAIFAKAEPGFLEALDAAQPLLIELGAEAPHIGAALSDMFHELAGAGEGAGEALRLILNFVVGGIVIFGRMAGSLSDVFAWIVRFTDAVSDSERKLTSWIPGVSSVTEAVHGFFNEIRFGEGDVTQLGRSLTGAAADAALTQDQMDQLAGTLGKARNNADTLAAAMSQKLFSSVMNLDEATLHWHESLTNLGDTLAQNGRAIDRHTHLVAENTQSGEQNRQAVLGAVSANMAHYQALVASGLGAQDAAAQYDANTRSLEKQMRQAGYTQAQIDDLIGKYRKIPDTVNTDIAMHGLTDAINDLDDAIRLANHLDGRVVTLTIQEQHRTSGGDAYGFTGHASGGIWGGMTWVGEQGAELVRLPQGSTVYPHGQSERMAGAAAGGGGGSGAGPMTMTIGGDLDSATSQLVQGWFRTLKIRLFDSTGSPVTVQ